MIHTSEEEICVSHNYVAALWREYDLQPHRLGTYKLSSDPAFEEKVIEVVGLYLDPPMDAVVLSIDEKTQIPRSNPAPVADDLRQEREAHP